MGLITPDESGIVDGSTNSASSVTSPLNTIINLVNGGLDDANFSATAGLTYGKTDKTTARAPYRQDLAVNVALTNQYIQHGAMYIQGTGAVSATATITLPVAFDNAAWDIAVTSIGFKATAPADRQDVTGIDSNTLATALVTSASQFTATLYRVDGAVWSDYRLFSWIAIGTKA